MGGVIDLRCFEFEKEERRKQLEEEKKKTFYKITKTEKNKPAEFSETIARHSNEKKILSEIIKTAKSEAGDKKTVFQNLKQKRKAEIFKFPRVNYNFCKQLIWQKSFMIFLCAAFASSAIIFFLSAAQKEIEKGGKILGASTEAYENLKQAGQSASNQDFQNSLSAFDSAKVNFSNTKSLIEGFGMGISGTIGNLPINTPISTAKNLAEAGENISLAGKDISVLFEKISKLDKEDFLINSIFDFQADINSISLNLKNSKENLNKIDLNYIPEEFREKIKLAKESMPTVANNFENLSEDWKAIAEILGKNHPQKYLLLLQNNSEARATGGFIGSYGILDIENGEIKNLFIDGVFNPDGQFEEKIIPPMPIQKISAAWSMHDANWFADFPTSAKKIALFYEKTGGPTVDGVISMTPDAVEKILRLTGPIEMPGYGVTISAENFLAQTQLQVEELYDKQENKPKKILADLAPKIIESLIDLESLDSRQKVEKYLGFINVMEESLGEKQMIFYHRNSEIENMIIKRGWGGQVLNSAGDYLSVVNSNINGFKTDKVIDEQIALDTEIFSDGSIVNTVKITREHTGGNESCDWYNRVNSDYMRVYVPLGSVLIEARGHTTQEYEPPIDYSNFKTDPDVEKIEKTIKVDPDSGTYIFQESEKTVFGNWVYASPGETVEVIYKYKLPYKINFDAFTKPAERYSILIQKQSGSKGSDFTGTIKLPGEWEAIWRSQGLNIKNISESVIKTDLKTDKIYGMVFGIRDVGN